jgi:hypothetical protein
MTKTVLYLLIATVVIVLTWLGRLNAQQSRGEAISIGTDIGGVVTRVAVKRRPLGPRALA